MGARSAADPALLHAAVAARGLLEACREQGQAYFGVVAVGGSLEGVTAVAGHAQRGAQSQRPGGLFGNKRQHGVAAFAGGGATTFPDARFEVAAVKGNAVFFAYDRPHPMTGSLHGGAPVVEGEKWVATKWLRVGRYT